jgi:hypothetical protein
MASPVKMFSLLFAVQRKVGLRGGDGEDKNVGYREKFK